MVIISSRVCVQKAGRDAEKDILKSKIQKVIRNYRRIGRLFRRPPSIDMHYLRSAAAIIKGV